MRWSLRLGHINGVPIEVHWLFAALVGWVAYQGWGQATAPTTLYLSIVDWVTRAQFSWERALAEWPNVLAGLRGAATGVGLLLLVFACVLIHEIGHTVHAQALGIPVRRIILLPIGGLALLARLPENPRDELRVALAGPAANVALALMLGAFAALRLLLAPGSLSVAESLQQALLAASPTLFGVVVYLAFANVSLVFFNLLPAFPMDGGRILRSLLAMILPRWLATRVVTWLGWGVGLGFIALGLGAAAGWGVSGSWVWLALGAFTLFGASVEETMERSRLTLRRIQAGAAVRQPTWTLAPTDVVTPALAASAFSLGRTVLPVVVGARLVGVLTRKDLHAALHRGGAPSVAHIMRTQFAYIRADEDLWQAQQLLTGSAASALPVVEGDTLRGMLTAADIRAARPATSTATAAEKPILVSGGNSNL